MPFPTTPIVILDPDTQRLRTLTFTLGEDIVPISSIEQGLNNITPSAQWAHLPFSFDSSSTVFFRRRESDGLLEFFAAARLDPMPFSHSHWTLAPGGRTVTPDITRGRGGAIDDSKFRYAPPGVTLLLITQKYGFFCTRAHEGKLVASNLPNVYEDGRVCTGESGMSASYVASDMKSTSIEYQRREFYSSAWNSDIGDAAFQSENLAFDIETGQHILTSPYPRIPVTLQRFPGEMPGNFFDIINRLEPYDASAI